MPWPISSAVKKLLVVAGWLMVVEMALLCLAPRGNTSLLFIVFLINRICSGTAEAAASGADESIAYDTLKAHGADHHWPAVLSRQMRLRSLGSIIALSVGAALYDPAFVQKLCQWVGWDITVTQDVTMRLPLILTFAFAVITLAAAYGMQETNAGGAPADRQSVKEALKLTLRAGGWIWRTPFALVLILAGVMFDNVTRVTITLGSQYYRLIEIPEAAFGIIGAGMAGIGMLVPSLAQRMTARLTPTFNFWILGLLTFGGLAGVSFFLPWFGLFPHGDFNDRHVPAELFSEPLPQPHHRIPSAGHGVELQGAFDQSGLRVQRDALRRPTGRPASGAPRRPSRVECDLTGKRGFQGRRGLVSMVFSGDVAGYESSGRVPAAVQSESPQSRIAYKSDLKTSPRAQGQGGARWPTARILNVF